MNKYKISNRDLIVFFIVTFGLTILMGIAMALSYSTYSVDSFPLVQMYYPALGVMVALLLNKELSNKIPKKFFQVYIFFVVSSIICLLIMLFIFHKDPSAYLETWLMIASFSLIIAYNMEDKERINKFGLKFKKNFKKSIPYIILFVIIYLSAILFTSLFQGSINEFIAPFKDLRRLVVLLLLPLSFALSFIAFFGEEYGWRYFLQPALQERMGKRKGVIVLGLIWGIWHLPINMFYYSPQTSLYSVLNQLIVCICYSVFFGLVYMKTQNIWTISIIHYLNNNLGAILYGGTGKDLVYSWQAIVFNAILLSVLYIPFLLAKEYRQTVEIDDSIFMDENISS